MSIGYIKENTMKELYYKIPWQLRAKFHVFQLLIRGQIVGEANHPGEDGFVRQVWIECKYQV